MVGSSPPAVAIDVTPMSGHRTGVGLAVAEAFDALTRLGEGCRLLPYAIGLRVPPGHHDLPEGTRVIRVPARALLLAWHRWDRPRLDRLLRSATVIHGTNFTAPPSRMPTMITVHDCTFARFPEWVSPAVREYGRVLRRAVDRGAWLHCTTRTVAGEVEDVFGSLLRARDRIVVVPFGVPRLGPPASLPAPVAARLGTAPCVLALGTMEPRKNLPRLVRAFGSVGELHPDLRLVLAGAEGPDRPRIERAIEGLPGPVRARVVRLGWVAASHRRALIEGAAVLAYPSLYEGFGFPMLEAMSLGVPVVAGKGGGLPEVAGSAALLVDPADTDAITAALHSLLTDERRRQELIARGRARAASFTWENTARGLAAAYRELAKSATSARS